MFEFGFEVPLRDGTVLRGLHYVPEVSPGPSVLMMSPYGADRNHPNGVFFASRGYHFVSLDNRGRGDSDGEFHPFVHDGQDGHDVVEWIARQPWSNGEVVTFGGSYCGFVQWAIAATRPPALRAMAPTASVYPGVDFPMAGGIFLAYTVRWLTYVAARRMNDGLFQDTGMWEKAARELIAAGRPFRDLDLVTVGRRLPVFQEWLDHPSFDEYWARFVPAAEQYADITIPVLTITGQYDDDQLGALTYHDEHIAHSRADHRVVIGPWDHRGTRTGARSFGGLTFAEQSALDLSALQADWFDWVLGRGERPGFLRDRVVYFHTGEDRWRSGDTIPGGPDALVLYPDGQSLSRTPPASRSVELAIDPRKDDDRGFRPAESAFAGDITELSGLVHISDPVGEQLDISGRPRVQLTLSSDLPDFDLLAELYLLRDQAISLGESPLRARCATASTVELSFPFISLRASAEDRFALVVGPPDHRYQVNQQAGGDLSAETGADAIAGIIRLVQDRSSVWLPITPA